MVLKFRENGCVIVKYIVVFDFVFQVWKECYLIILCIGGNIGSNLGGVFWYCQFVFGKCIVNWIFGCGNGNVEIVQCDDVGRKGMFIVLVQVCIVAYCVGFKCLVVYIG